MRRWLIFFFDHPRLSLSQPPCLCSFPSHLMPSDSPDSLDFACRCHRDEGAMLWLVLREVVLWRSLKMLLTEGWMIDFHGHKLRNFWSLLKNYWTLELWRWKIVEKDDGGLILIFSVLIWFLHCCTFLSCRSCCDAYWLIDDECWLSWRWIHVAFAEFYGESNEGILVIVESMMRSSVELCRAIDDEL